MADPRTQEVPDDTDRLGPEALDEIPADWATTRYTATIDEHPDVPGLPIIKWFNTAASGGGSARVVTSLIVGPVSPSGQVTGTLTIAKGTVLYRVRETLNHQCRVRLYGSSAARDADVARARSVSPVSGSGTTGTGIACDLVLSSAESYDIKLDPKAVLANHADTPTTTIYYTIDNLSGGPTTISLQFYHTPIEA